MGVFDRFTAAHLRVAKRQVTGVAVGSLPVDREVARRAGADFLEVFERADRSDLSAAIDLVDDRADFECLG